MVLVEGPTIAGIASASISPRSKKILSSLQLVIRGNVTWADKAAWFRNPPYTAVNPHLGQLEIRREFGKTAKTTKGTRGLQVVTKGRAAGKALPGAAKTIAETLTGRTMPHSLPPDQYPSRLRRTLHTLDELEVMYQKKLAEYGRLGGAAGP